MGLFSFFKIRYYIDVFFFKLDFLFIAEKSDSNMKTNYIYKYDFKNNLDTGSLKGKHYDDSENYGADHDQDSSGVTSISRDISDVYSFSSLSPCQSEEESLPWNGVREAKNQSILFGQEDSGMIFLLFLRLDYLFDMVGLI